jgi:hypothetical protein
MVLPLLCKSILIIAFFAIIYSKSGLLIGNSYYRFNFKPKGKNADLALRIRQEVVKCIRKGY